MKMPGFTAEGSAYTSTVCYRSIPSRLEGAAAAIIPAQFCEPFVESCGACIPTGPSIFSPGKQFCQIFTCTPTPFGGCRCRLTFKGFVPCDPFPDPVATV
jgi:hypothetical protein